MASVHVPKGAQVIAAQGKYMIPGLWDMHIHPKEYVDVFYPLLISTGVTGLRDAGTPVPLDTVRKWRREITAGMRVGPRQFVAGRYIDEREDGFSFKATTPEEARNAVKTLKEAGADFIFAEAVYELSDFTRFADQVKLPILANITEFGMTPLFTTEELGNARVSLVLYPLSAFRAANKAAQNVYQHIRNDGTQANVIENMQTRTELYNSIGYHEYEKKLDALYKPKKDGK